MANSRKYGPTLKSGEAEKFIMDIFEVSRAEKAAGRKGIPVTSWGPAGIGKTELPNAMVKKYKDFFGGNIVYLPMAQIEEKAELQGLPELLETLSPYNKGDEVPTNSQVKSVVNAVGEIEEFLVRASTVYATPSWIPQEDTHGKRGLLVIDDMNRADERIINSIMQLLQDGKLLGWTLPEEWEIYCTCNPDDGEYQVTSLDGAQMSRMANFYQEFDEKAWLTDWAIPTGLHQTAQNFVLAMPESVVQGERTNPRSFDKFFRLIETQLDELMKGGTNSIEGDLVRTIKVHGEMNLDEEAIGTFVSFITQGFGKLPSVEEICHPEFDLDELYRTLKTQGQLRVDIISSLDTRLNLFAKSWIDAEKDIKEISEGMKKWMKHPELPGELRYKSVRANAGLAKELSDRELAQIVFSRALASI